MAGGIVIPNPIDMFDEVAGIQVNFCRTPACPNFGQPPAAIIRGRGAGAKNTHNVAGAGKHLPGLHCKTCRHTTLIKSNLGVAEELERISAYLEPTPPSCPEPSCSSHGRSVYDHPKRYQRYGKTARGSQRFICKTCKTRFVEAARPTLRQRRKDLNARLFLHFVNGAAFRRMLETNVVGFKTLYGKLDFIWRQCRAYAGAQERRLGELPIRRLYLSSDRQDYLVNWSLREDRRATQLGAVATADNLTRFVFAINLDYDPSVSQDDIEKAATKVGDKSKAIPARRYARFWLGDEYKKAHKEKRAGIESHPYNLRSDVERAETAALARPDIEIPPVEPHRMLPHRGAQVRREYTFFAHFQLLRRLTAGAEKVRFYLDLDPSLRGACFSAFHEKIRDERCDVFYVKIAKRSSRPTKESLVGTAWAEFDLMLEKVVAQLQAGATIQTIDPGAATKHWEADLLTVTDDEIEKALLRRRANRRLNRMAVKSRRTPAPGMKRGEELGHEQKAVEAFVRRLMIKNLIPQLKQSSTSTEFWLTHPMPLLSEPRKMVALLTKPDHLQEDQIAHLYDRASLHGIDQFFMQLRRRLKMTERALNVATSGREYHIYQPYNPAILAKLIEVLRVYYNYVIPGSDAQTPAMRIGLCTKPATLRQILAFKPRAS